MDSLLCTLCCYAHEHMVDHYLLLEREPYQDACLVHERILKRLQSRLGPVDLEDLEKLVDSLEERTSLEGEALFLSGLSMGLTLGRLPG